MTAPLYKRKKNDITQLELAHPRQAPLFPLPPSLLVTHYYTQKMSLGQQNNTKTTSRSSSSGERGNVGRNVPVKVSGLFVKKPSKIQNLASQVGVTKTIFTQLLSFHLMGTDIL